MSSKRIAAFITDQPTNAQAYPRQLLSVMCSKPTYEIRAGLRTTRAARILGSQNKHLPISQIIASEIKFTSRSFRHRVNTDKSFISF